jgi:hypothetical protein
VQTYSRRLRDFLGHEGDEALTGGHVRLLAVGRHLRLPSGRKVARVTAGYSDGQDEPAVRVEVRCAGRPVEVLTVVPMAREEAQALMV